MFLAIGTAGRQTADGQLEVSANITTDDGQTLVARVVIVGKDLTDVRQQLAADLARRKAAETDATLSAAIVGRQLAAI